jgi:hypothetical protein
MGRMARFTLAAMLGVMASLGPGCTRKPTPQGSQTVESAGESGQLSVRMTGPASVSGKASLDHPALVELTLAISGPAGSKVHIIGSGEPANGCHFDREFPDVAVGGDGTAESKGLGFLGRADGCTFDASVVLYLAGHEPGAVNGDDVARPRMTVGPS